MTPSEANTVTMPWGTIIALASTGIGMALLSSLVGMRQKIEIRLWWSLYAIWVAVVLLTGIAAPFLTILIASVLAGVLHATTQGLLINHYRRNNPWYADQMKGSNAKSAAQFLMMGVIIGTGFGALVGVIAWGIARL